MKPINKVQVILSKYFTIKMKIAKKMKDSGEFRIHSGGRM
jgi:hypothetical protein